MIAYLKATRPQFSYRYFSRVAGFSSPNFLKLVAEGKRNLSPQSIAKFARGLGLDQREQETFETLVLLGQAETDAERNRYYARLRRRTSSSAAARLEDAQYKVYSLWYALPIREMLLLPDFQEDPAWIGRRLRPQVRPNEVKTALQLLEQVGLIVRDETGRLRPQSSKISTGPRVRSLAVRNYHRAMLEVASGTLDGVAVEDRDVTSLTLTLTRAQYEEVRARIERFRRELLDLAEDARPAVDDASSEVFQVGFQLFPLTRKDTQ
ncbi:TIGR02147 family protein [Myxococcota bacterium]|nr:TIGR02147 family protein [Myxococcota bacterium]